jgi:hypothetical protein
MYQSLDMAARKEVAAETDRLFIAKTRVHRKIDERNPADRILVRQWLLIRDAVMAIHFFDRISRQAKHRNLQAELESELARENLAGAVLSEGSQEELSGPLLAKIIKGAHSTTEVIHLVEIFEDLWPHVAVEALEKTGIVTGVIGAVLSPIATMMEIVEAHEVGDREAEINAFIWGFASQLVHGRVFNPLPSNSHLGRKQILGDRAARRYLMELPADARVKFLKRYRGPQRYAGENIDKALSDMGYRR